MKSLLSVATGLLCLLFLNGCIKNLLPKKDNVCDQIQNIKISGAKASYYTGDPIQLSTDDISDTYYSWHQTNAVNEISTTNGVSVSSCTKSDEGWYYVAVSNPECSTRVDSVYITVINKPVTAPCTPPNNSVSFSAIPGISFGSTTWATDPTWGCRNLRGYQSFGYPDINIYFNYYWNNREPEDGEYSITSTLTFPDHQAYSVFMATTYSSVYFQPYPGKVYVSHVNGKLQVTFCSIQFSGDLGGTPFKTTATGRLTAP